VTDSSLKGEYMSTKLATAQPFNDTSRAILEDLLSRLTSLYTRCVTYGDEPAAIRALKLHQREHIAWERDTVWRTMINQARRGGNSSDTPPLLEGAPTIVTADPEKALVEVPTPLGTFKVTKKLLFLAIAVAVGVTLLNIQVVDGVEANRCLAVLVFCTIMWATEVRVYFYST
jgi:phosphate transporter